MKYILKNKDTGDAILFDKKTDIYKHLKINGRYFRRTMSEINKGIDRKGKRFQSLKKYQIVKIPTKEWKIYKSDKSKWTKRQYNKNKEIFLRIYNLLH